MSCLKQKAASDTEDYSTLFYNPTETDSHTCSRLKWHTQIYVMTHFRFVPRKASHVSEAIEISFKICSVIRIKNSRKL